jgi:hypothetical protein
MLHIRETCTEFSASTGCAALTLVNPAEQSTQCQPSRRALSRAEACRSPSTGLHYQDPLGYRTWHRLSVWTRKGRKRPVIQLVACSRQRNAAL